MKPEILFVMLGMPFLLLPVIDFICPRMSRQHGYDPDDIYRRSLWEKVHEKTSFWYDLDPCHHVGGEDCTDAAEIVLDREPVTSNIHIIGCGGGGGRTQQTTTPGDTAMCPSEECAVVPALIQINDGIVFGITFSKYSWWYKHMRFLGVTSDVKMDWKDFLSYEQRFVYLINSQFLPLQE